MYNVYSVYAVYGVCVCGVYVVCMQHVCVWCACSVYNVYSVCGVMVCM